MRTILAGCGGGYDIFGAIPMYLDFLKSKKPILVSLSFTPLEILNILVETNQIRKIGDTLFSIDAEKISDQKFDYFPEYHLSRHLKQEVYLILCDSTIAQIIQGYNKILSSDNLVENPVDSIYLMDGGCDALLSGKETELATPVEDMMHIRAVMELPIENKYICAIGMPCDIGHGVIRKELEIRLEEIEGMIVEKKQWSLDDENVQEYHRIFRDSNPSNSIVHSLICAALEDHRGFYTPEHLRRRISESVVEIDSLMLTFVIYNMPPLYREVLYMHLLDLNDGRDEVDDKIELFQKRFKDKFKK